MHEERRAAAMKEIEGLLTAQQARTWSELIGPRTTISWPMFMPGPPPNGPGGPRGPMGPKEPNGGFGGGMFK
jgi:hypothetical protein